MPERHVYFRMSILCGFVLHHQLQQKMSHPARNGSRKCQTAGVSQGSTIFIAKAFRSVQTTFRMVLNEIKKVLLCRTLLTAYVLWPAR